MGEIKAYILEMTEKAVRLANSERPKGIWFPRSQIALNFSQEPLVSQTFSINNWILQKKGINVDNETDRFKVKLYGLSEDMEDFMLEQDDSYTHTFHKFYTSFWHTCVSMWQNRIDLSDKQLTIIYREYKKVKKSRKAGVY